MEPAHERGELGRFPRHVHLVAVQGRRVGVVPAVAVLPGEVGHEERRVEREADGVVQRRVLREGVVAALMLDHPHTVERATLHRPVERPRRQAERTTGGEQGIATNAM